MGFGAFDIFNGLKGSNGYSSSDLNSKWSTGGSDASNKTYSGLDPEAKAQWAQLFSGYTSPTGVAPWQQAGFESAIKLANNKFSGVNAARGGQNPYTTPQIASSSAQYVLPQFAQMNTQALNALMGQRQISTGDSTSMSRGPGLDYLNAKSGTDNWWGMWNNIGSSWGGRPGGGGGGGGKMGGMG